MGVRRLRGAIFLLVPVYVCLVFIAFFTFIFTRSRRPEHHIKKEQFDKQYGEPVTLIAVFYNSSNIPGVLNLHIWNDLCGLEVDRIRQTPLFPRHPHQRLFLRKFETSRHTDSYGQRIFGFIEPNVTGLYSFAISSDDASELWLSLDDKPSNLRLIASVFSEAESAWTKDGVFTKYPTQHSRNFRLVAHNKYFVEALHKQAQGSGHVKVYWRKPGSLKLESIGGEYLSSYYDDRKIKGSTGLKFVEQKLERLYSWAPSHIKQTENNGLNLRVQFNYTSLPLIDSNIVRGSLPKCLYKPSYIVEKNLSRYEGVQLIHTSVVYPDDQTYMGQSNSWSLGNKCLDNATVDDVVGRFVSSLQIFRRRYYLQRILNVEQNSDPKMGTRYLIELQLGLRGSNRSFRLSEYVYIPSGKKELCFPEGMEWQKNATVYFILPVKNQGQWVHHFASQLANVSLETGDLNFHVIIVDFESEDIDIDRAFSVSPLKERYTLIKMTGPFYKTLAIQEGVKAVPDDQDIVFLFDLHIDVPIGILDSVRKHTIQGKMAYAPVVGRLECGMFPSNPRGFWQEDGYGILSVFKVDWTRFGGMNVKDFTTRWGGEDWDLVDRVLTAKLEIERLKQPGLLHYYHSHAGMWQR